MIHTSYYARLKDVPSGVVPVAVSCVVPEWYTGLTYQAIAPSSNLVRWYKEGKYSEEDFTKGYKQKLKAIDQDEFVEKLIDLTGSEDIVLLCYEKSYDFCHRHIIAEWLNDAGYECEEMSF